MIAMAVNNPRPMVTLTTDFGVGSPYVAQMKGVLFSRNPELCIVDISHGIPPQDIRAGAIVLDEVCRRFPPRTIHVAVIDPGVGTPRELVFVKVGPQRYVAPDNGLLSCVVQRRRPDAIVAITNPLYFMPDISSTFHGRDIMAPVAAHLSLGLHPERLGPPRDSLVLLPDMEPLVESQQVAGHVVQIDSFGNVITNITARHLASLADRGGARVTFCGASIAGIVTTYGEKPAGTLIALIGSSDRLELAEVNGNAAVRLSASVGDSVVVTW
jgi:S-adenosylmethionine hydrolase